MLDIRDFIYLDTERLKSILSQIDEGLLESIAVSGSDHRELGGSSEGSVWGFLKAGGKATLQWHNQQTETRTLHDHIYNLVEKALAEQEMLIRIPGDISELDVRNRRFESMLSETSYILVTGAVILNDFEHMRQLLANYKQITKATVNMKIKAETVGMPSKAKQQAIIDAQKEVEIDQDTLKGLQTILEFFCKNRFVIKMMPIETQPDFRLVGSLHPEYLREDMPTIIYKYGSAPIAQWHMLAQIASIPGPDYLPAKWDMTGLGIEIALQGLFNAIRGIEAVALSVAYPEVAVTPIAVYRG
jgi:hypothetical protein